MSTIRALTELSNSKWSHVFSHIRRRHRASFRHRKRRQDNAHLRHSPESKLPIASHVTIQSRNPEVLAKVVGFRKARARNALMNEGEIESGIAARNWNLGVKRQLNAKSKARE
ncbi:hypothetical protein AVEN_36219-1 [Araneus ventricosus]|uniref:Uncharacterized protein n=1 Tax=Araneus ventricosus TaxID=182803 RepID=A0A4Y2UQ40_ARAVE|nr:hypothetical protein AVEN_36219-1 [Araneus ventricosus]